MRSVAFAVRLLPGQAEADRIALASCWASPRTQAYQDARRRAGLAAALTILGSSAEPFDRWFRDRVRQVHGIAWERGFPAPEVVLDFDTGRMYRLVVFESEEKAMMDRLAGAGMLAALRAVRLPWRHAG